MSRSAKLLAASLACAAITGAAGFMTAGVAEPAKAPASTGSIDALPTGLGREAKPEEIAGWAIAVRPDGQGLPDGRGTVLEGEEVYVAQCAVCHGDFGEGAGRWPTLAGGEGTLASHDPVKTIG
ncbi:MAG TPA: c-type cytochrome, partial [Saliniramus sp.]|nr:c-type cytochrome [Saliniramus sp.]